MAPYAMSGHSRLVRTAFSAEFVLRGAGGYQEAQATMGQGYSMTFSPKAIFQRADKYDGACPINIPFGLAYDAPLSHR
jgi:hypothetical protein